MKLVSFLTSKSPDNHMHTFILTEKTRFTIYGQQVSSKRMGPLTTSGYFSGILIGYIILLPPELVFCSQ